MLDPSDPNRTESHYSAGIRGQNAGGLRGAGRERNSRSLEDGVAPAQTSQKIARTESNSILPLIHRPQIEDNLLRIPALIKTFIVTTADNDSANALLTPGFFKASAVILT